MKNLELTTEQIKRVENDLNHTKILLGKALAFSVDLRDDEIISFYEKHIEKLSNIIDNKSFVIA